MVKSFEKCSLKLAAVPALSSFAAPPILDKRKELLKQRMLRHIVPFPGGQVDPGSIVKRDEVFTPPVLYMPDQHLARWKCKSITALLSGDKWIAVFLSFLV